jgi:hypothetical protein
MAAPLKSVMAALVRVLSLLASLAVEAADMVVVGVGVELVGVEGDRVMGASVVIEQIVNNQS